MRLCVVRVMCSCPTYIDMYFLKRYYLIIQIISRDSSVGIVTMLPAEWHRSRGSISRLMTENVRNGKGNAYPITGPEGLEGE
jgi:hypothetical protein